MTITHKAHRCHPISKRTGFTLIEIMVVVSIIGVLLAIAVPSFVHTRETAQSKSCIENLKKLQLAKESWAMDNNKASTATPTQTDLIGAALYLKVMPQCNAGGTYSLNDIGTAPTCSIGGTHQIQ